MKRVTRLVLASMLVPVAAGCTLNPATGQREFIAIPPSQEVAMGLEAAPQFEQEFGGRVPDEALQAYVQGLGKRIAATSDRPELPWEFRLVNSTTPNAFALPGGQVFVTAGLFGGLDNERQLAAVVGHEIAHCFALHNVKGLQRQMGAEVFTKVLQDISGDERVNAAAKVASSMAVLKYSRDDEYQADEYGTRYMERAGYNPWGMVETMRFLLSLSQGGSKLEELFQTHPLSSERVKKAEGIVKQRFPSYQANQPDPQRARFQEMRGRLARAAGG